MEELTVNLLLPRLLPAVKAACSMGREYSRILRRFSRRESNAKISPHRDTHQRIEAWRDPFEASETLCRQSSKKRIWSGMDAVRSGCGGSRSRPASAARRV